MLPNFSARAYGVLFSEEIPEIKLYIESSNLSGQYLRTALSTGYLHSLDLFRFLL